MAYRVVYGARNCDEKNRHNFSPFVPLLSVMFFLVFLWLISSLWPEGAAVLQDVLLPGEPEITRHALETLAEELQSGIPVGDAVESFCREIFLEAGVVQN